MIHQIPRREAVRLMVSTLLVMARFLAVLSIPTILIAQHWCVTMRLSVMMRQVKQYHRPRMAHY